MVKRSRIGTSSNLAKNGGVNYAPSPWQHYGTPAPAPAPTSGLNPLVGQLSSGFERAPLGRVLRLSSPENHDFDRARIGFLEKCYYCNKKILQDKEVFMYSEHAFCNPLCREIQILRDTGKLQTAKRKAVD